MSSPSSKEAHEARRREQEAIHNQVLIDSIFPTLVFGTALAGVSFLANRYVPSFQRITPAFKTFIVVSGTTGCYFTIADRKSIAADRKFAQRYSIVKEEHAFREWAISHKYNIVGGAWCLTMVGALAYNWFRRDITRAQKLINARLTAQTVALLGMAASAAASAVEAPVVTVDPHYEAIVGAPRPSDARH